MNDLSYFNKISQVSMNELLDFLDHNKTEITLKVFDRYIKTNIRSKKNEKYFSLIKSGSYEFSNEPVTCIFQVKEDRYFFKSHITNTNVDYTVEIPSEIYQLQRRNDYRVSMPIGVIYKCEVVSINGIKAGIPAQVRNIGLGGFQISITSTIPGIKSNDELELNLKLDKFEFEKLKLIAKHIKIIETQNTTLIGSSLHEPESALLSELQSMLMYLDRVHRGINE